MCEGWLKKGATGKRGFFFSFYARVPRVTASGRVLVRGDLPFQFVQTD